jgi:plastocyanin
VNGFSTVLAYILCLIGTSLFHFKTRIMKRELLGSILATALIFSSSANAAATVHTITVADFNFSPATGLTVQLGDTVRWVWASGAHTTTSTGIPTGAASWDQPITSANMSYSYVPTVSGTYSYVCTPHSSMGMIGSFVVTNATAVPQTPAETGFMITPNPARSVISVRSAGSSPAVNALDMSGRLLPLQQVSVSGGDRVFSVANLPAGLYIIQVRSGNGLETRKLVVEK